MAKQKLAVVTINIGTYYEVVSKMTIPTMQAYAERIGADFIEINEAKLKNQVDNYSAYWAKFQLFDHLEDYDRLIYLDLDTVVRPHCPNLFEMVPEDTFAALYETDYMTPKHAIDDLETPDGPIPWDGKYFNVGVMVVSKCHRPAFKLENGFKGGKKYPEQTLLNANIRDMGYPTQHLDYRFNHMYFIGKDNRLRAESFIIHYAAIPQVLRNVLIEDDLMRFEQEIPVLSVKEMGPYFQQKYPDVQFQGLEYRLQKDEEIGLA